MKRLAVFIFVITLFFAGCDGKTGKYTVYYGSEDGKALAEETVKLEIGGTEEYQAGIVVEKLLSGPYRSEHKRVIPEGTSLISLRLKSNVATVNLSQEFEKYSGPADRLLARYSIVKTLCGIEGISKVQILVNGRGLTYETTGEEIGELSMNNVILDDEIGKNQTTIMTLFFASKDKKMLVAEKRLVDVKDNETIERSVINEILKGPEEGLRVIPSDVNLISVEAKDKICYVNLSGSFLEIPKADMPLAVYSIVNSLAQTGRVGGVQFLINGEKAATVGDMNLSEPIIYSNKLITEN